jgi:hypothetical protein
MGNGEDAGKLADELEKIRQTGVWNRRSVFITAVFGVLGALLTGLVSAYVALNTTTETTEAQKVQKAAELALIGATSPAELQARTRLLREFGLLASPSIDVYDAGTRPEPRDPPTYNKLWGSAEEARLAFFQVAAGKATCPEQVVELWRQLWGPHRVYDTGGNNEMEWAASLSLTPCPYADSEPTAR